MTGSFGYDLIILGGGAAGLMCAISAGQRGLRTLVLERSNRIGKKILMSGGGRCNFTNLNTRPENFISANPHFCKSALSRYGPASFLALVEEHGIPWHEKAQGQLFCDRSAKDIVAMLADECRRASAEIRTRCEIESVSYEDGFTVKSSLGEFSASNLVIATGGLSIPRMGASDFGHRLARQFGLEVLPLSAGLVPFTLSQAWLRHSAELAGVSADIRVYAECGADFSGNMLFTHRGISGPSILQISSYWRPGQVLEIDLLPDMAAQQWLADLRRNRPRQSLRNAIGEVLGRRLADLFCAQILAPAVDAQTGVADLNKWQLADVARQLNALQVRPEGTEGYRTAEVTLGGVNTDELSSRTMQAHKVPGLYLVGEVVDVTGQLGGHNFQWAWASGWCAGQAVG